MTGKNVKISRLERFALWGAVIFAAGSLLWFFFSPSGEETMTVETAHPARAVLEVPPPPAPGLLPGEKIDLNSAPPEELTRLPGIGEKRAADIVAWRETHGGFASVEDLLSVKGIGEKTIERLRPYLTAGPAEQEGEQYGTDPGCG